MSPDTEPPTYPAYTDKWDRITELLKAYRLPITALLVVAGAVIYRQGLPAVAIPAWVRPLALGIMYGAIPAYVTGLWIVSKFFPDPRAEVIEANLNDEGRITARSWLVPWDVWETRNRGDHPSISPDHGADAIVTELEELEDLETISVEGANEEIGNPISIAARQGRLEVLESELIPKAEEKDKLEATVRARALDIQSENIHSLLSAVEDGSQMDPSATEAAFEDDLVSFDDPGADQREGVAEGSHENGEHPADMDPHAAILEMLE